MRVIHLVDSNHSVLDKFYYSLRTTKQCIEKKISDIYYKGLFPDIKSTVNIWNMSDDKSGEKESLSKYHTNYSENICVLYKKIALKGRNIPILIMLLLVGCYVKFLTLGRMSSII